MLGDVVAEAAVALGTVQRATLRATVTPTEITWNATLALPTTGGVSLVDDALGRAASRGAHPLLAVLPADALLVLGNRASASSRRAMLRSITAAALRVLGDRVAANPVGRISETRVVLVELDEMGVHAGPRCHSGHLWSARGRAARARARDVYPCILKID